MCEQGIVISSVKYGDDSRIVSIFFAKEGMVPFLVKMTKGKQSNYLKALLMPLNIVEVEGASLRLPHGGGIVSGSKFTYAPKQEKHPLPIMGIEGGLIKATIKLFLAEVLRAVLRHEKENEELYNFIVTSLEWLEKATEGFANFHLVFMAHMLKYLGYNPVYDDGFGDLKKFLDCDYDKMNLHTMNHNERTHYMEVLLMYYKSHLPEFPEIKSLDVLKECFSD